MIRRFIAATMLAVLVNVVWMAGGSAAAIISNFHLSLTADGPAMTRFPSGTDTIYVVFDYADAEDTPIRVIVWDDWGNVLYDDVRTYNGAGRQVIRITADPRFEDTRPGQSNVATIFVDEFPTESIEWTVGADTTPTPTPTPPAEVPEAGTLLLLGSGLAGLAAYARLRARAARASRHN
jgi:hypothetical protein